MSSLDAGDSDTVPFGPRSNGVGEYTRIKGLVGPSPDEAWNRLLEVTARTDDAGLYWVADIIEDLVAAHRAPFVVRLEAELAQNRRLRQAFVDFVPLVAGDEPLHDRLLVLREEIEREPGDDGPS